VANPDIAEDDKKSGDLGDTSPQCCREWSLAGIWAQSIRKRKKVV